MRETRVGVPYIYNGGGKVTLGGVFSSWQFYFLVNITKNYVSKEKICWTNVGLSLLAGAGVLRRFIDS